MKNRENGLAMTVAAITASDADNNLLPNPMILQLFLPAIRGISACS
jgi:hypothetical protein